MASALPAFTDLPRGSKQSTYPAVKPAFAAPGPAWGDLRPVLSARLMDLDHAHLVEWLAGDCRFSVETIGDNMRKLRRLEREGFQGQVFLQGPDQARLEVRRIRAKLRLAGAPDNTLRHSEVVFNRLAQYAATVDPRFQGVRWELTPERRGQPKTITHDQHDRAMQYRHPVELIEKRRRALLWLTDNLGWRRSEVTRMRVQDLDEASGMAYMAFPAKKGAPMWWPLPRDAWSPKRPLKAWLAIRPVDPDRPDALWTHQRYPGDVPRAYSVGGIGTEMATIGRELGFNVGFIRFRRYDTTRMDEDGVHPRVIQKKRNHRKIDTTLHYMGEMTPERALAELVKRGSYGFKAAGRKAKTGQEIVEAELDHRPKAVDDVAVCEAVPALHDELVAPRP
jgi:site-specific recombinase XerC